MAYTYETVVTSTNLDLFEDALVNYMNNLDFRHTTVGGRLGGHASHEFQHGNQVITLTVSSMGQSTFRIVMDSEKVPVEPVVLRALADGIADFLKPFWNSLPPEAPNQTIESTMKRLRSVFAKILDEKD